MKKFLFSAIALLLVSGSIYAQVTTSSLTGLVTDEKGETLPGASIVAVHNPSGSRYASATNSEGRYNIPGMRVGGPYTVTVKFIGYQDRNFQNINLTLGNASTVDAQLETGATQLDEVVITAAGKNDIISADRTGAATNVSREAIQSLPTISRSINDFTRITPQANGTSFGGQDNRLNNITIDGSLFNNSFGLSGQPGGRTGVAPISLDAIDQLQVNIAPFDIRQSGFTGASINAVTKSGTNNFYANGFFQTRTDQFVGDKVNTFNLTKQNFESQVYGLSLGGPIVKDKLFLFVNAETQKLSTPASSVRALEPGETAGGNISEVPSSDLNGVSSQLASIGYETGVYQNYNFNTPGDRLIARLDWNINDKNKFTLNYKYFDSSTDQNVSNSTSLGFGNRFNSRTAMSFRNSNYIQTENINSIIGELNSSFGTKLSNNLIVGYTHQNEDRASIGQFFPLIEIQNAGSTYITAGFEPFTPNNKLQYDTYQLQNNLTYYANKHTLTAALNLERLEFENVFYPGSQSVYVFNSINDFNTAINSYKANPNETVSPVSLRRFQLRFSALPGGAEPVQPTKVWYGGFGLQDEFQVTPDFKLTGGIRADIPFFDETGLANPGVTPLTFRRGDGSAINVSTDQLPDAKILLSPRVGFNYNANGDNSLQIRGGTGIFTGRPAFVWISNQIGNNGVLTGFESIDNTTTRPFKPDPTAYIPADPAAGLPVQYEINITDPGFKFPQEWKSNLAVDKTLFGGLIGTVELLYSKTINGVDYENINLEAANSTFAGPDNRPKYPGYGLTGGAFNSASRINDNISSAIFLTNTNKGYAYSATAAIERPYARGFYFKGAYTYGQAKNVINAGSIAGGSYSSNNIVFDGNNAPLAFSNDDQRHRTILVSSYKKSYRIGSSEISLFGEARKGSNFSYRYSSDFNGDGSNNDLIYIPNNASELKFVDRTITVNQGTPREESRTFTAAEQSAFFDQYLNQDKYLNDNRGQYAERNGALSPWVFRADASFTQEFKIAGERLNTNNLLQFRVDVTNLTNLINKEWGVRKFVNRADILTPRGVDANGITQFQYNSFSGLTPVTTTFGTGTSIGTDTYSAQFTIRYIFQ